MLEFFYSNGMLAVLYGCKRIVFEEMPPDLADEVKVALKIAFDRKPGFYGLPDTFYVQAPSGAF